MEEIVVGTVVFYIPGHVRALDQRDWRHHKDTQSGVVTKVTPNLVFVRFPSLNFPGRMKACSESCSRDDLIHEDDL